MKTMFQMTEGERRAAVAGVNLFFAALLGANLGTVNMVSLKDHVYLSILIAGAVSGLFLAAVSSRRSISVGILAAYAILLVAIILVPDFGPERIDRQFQTIVSTLAVWTGFLLIMRFTPVIHSTRAEPLSIQDELGTAASNREEDAE